MAVSVPSQSQRQTPPMQIRALGGGQIGSGRSNGIAPARGGNGCGLICVDTDGCVRGGSGCGLISVRGAVAEP